MVQKYAKIELLNYYQTLSLSYRKANLFQKHIIVCAYHF